MTKLRNFDAASALAAPYKAPEQIEAEEAAALADEQLRAAKHAARKERREKQHARLRKSAKKWSHEDLAFAASTLMLLFIEQKKTVLIQDELLQLLRSENEQTDSENKVFIRQIVEIKLARMRATTARHAENHALRQEAVNWYLEHRDTFPSKDDAAEAISGKVVPAKFRTVRKWLMGL